MAAIIFPAGALAAIAKGDKITAIKLVREANDLDLRSAMQAVEAHLRQHGAPIAGKASNEAPRHLSTRVQAAIARGEIIDAIKQVREETGLGLKEAKDLVEAHRGLRSTSSRPETVSRDRAGQIAGWAIGLLVLIVLVYLGLTKL